MRAKYAREIRAGIEAARRVEICDPKCSALTWLAYRRTIYRSIQRKLDWVTAELEGRR